MARQFKKLNIDLPRQPLSDQRLWQIAGLLFAFVILIFILYSYLVYRNDSSSFQQLNVNSYQTSFTNSESRDHFSANNFNKDFFVADNT